MISFDILIEWINALEQSKIEYDLENLNQYSQDESFDQERDELKKRLKEIEAMDLAGLEDEFACDWSKPKISLYAESDER